MILADIGLVLHDWRQVDWDSHAGFVQCVGQVLTVIFFVLRLVQDTLLAGVGEVTTASDAFDLSKSEWLRQDEVMMSYSDVLFRDWNQGDMRCSSGSGARFNQLINRCCLLMLGLSFVATYKFLYGNFKNYTLFYLKNLNEDKYNGSLRRIKIRVESQKLGTNSSVKEILVALFKTLWSILRKDKDEFGDVQEEIVDTEYFELIKWTPSRILLGFMVSFSPTVLYFLKFTTVSFLSIVPVVIHQIVLYMIIMERYEIRLANELLLTRENIEGYEKRFVKPKENKSYQDVMLDTIDLDDGGFVRFFPSVSNKLFKRHRINGEQIIEKYNKKNDTFDNVTKRIINNKPTKNKIYQIKGQYHSKNKDFRNDPHIMTLKNRVITSHPNSKEAVATAKPLNNDFYDNSGAGDEFLSSDSDEDPKFFPATPLRKQRR